MWKNTNVIFHHNLIFGDSVTTQKLSMGAISTKYFKIWVISEGGGWHPKFLEKNFSRKFSSRMGRAFMKKRLKVCVCVCVCVCGGGGGDKIKPALGFLIFFQGLVLNFSIELGGRHFVPHIRSR